MANIAIFKTGKPAQYLTSVNTPDYSSDPDVIIDPDISNVQSVPLKYWKRVGNTIVEMTQAEKDVILASELQARKDAITDPSFGDIKDILTALIKVINIRLPQNQKITKQEIIDAIKAEII